MKTKIIWISLVFILSLSTCIMPQQASARGYVSSQVFYDDLSPYGTWVNSPYGYVWLPDAGSDFVPYSTNGKWVYTDAGWTWISNYPWGWAPFHYGRWYTDPTYGPVWFPGYEWSPAWVTWRSSNDYYGWAAMEPGVSIATAYSKNYYPRHNYWTVKKGKNFNGNNHDNYYINTRNNKMVMNNSKVINNNKKGKNGYVMYNAGPYKHEVEKHIGRKITPYVITERNKPGQYLANNQLHIYKPNVQKNNSKGHKIAPSNVIGFKDTKALSQRKYKTPAQKTSKISPYKSTQKHSSPTKKDNVIKQPAKSNPTYKSPGGNKNKQTAPSHKEQGSKQGKQSSHGKK